jgi:porin
MSMTGFKRICFFMVAACSSLGQIAHAQAADAPESDAAAAPELADSAPAHELTLFPIPPYGGSLKERMFLTGDWGGERTKLAERGFQFYLNSTWIWQNVVDGGKRTGSEFGGAMEILALADFSKFAWPGGFLMIRGEQYFEDVISPRAGGLLPPNTQSLFPEPGDHDLALSTLQFTQFLSPKVAVAIGKLDTTGGDMNAFAHGRGDEGFLHPAFSFNPVPGIGVPAYALGTALILLPSPKLTIALNVVDTEGTAMTSGFDTVFEGGTSYAAEARLTTNLFDRPGHHTFGFLYADDEYLHLSDAVDISLPRYLGRRAFSEIDTRDDRSVPFAGQRPNRHLSWYLDPNYESQSVAAYYNFDQYIRAEKEDPTQGVGVFGRVGIGDDDTNPIAGFYSLGVGGKGVFDGRDLDRFGVGYYYMDISNKIAEGLNLGNEQGVEAYYTYALTPWFHLTADAQWIDPASQNVDSAVILGLRGRVQF